jgi:hypothetical protein
MAKEMLEFEKLADIEARKSSLEDEVAWRIAISDVKASKEPGMFARTLASLYIDDVSLKVLVTREKQVIKWAELELEPGMVNHGLINTPAIMAETLKKFLRSQDLSHRDVIIGFSGLHCLSRVITLPVLKNSVLDEAVRREVERELPISLENFYLAWQIVDRSARELKVFIVTYTRAAADALMKTLKLAGVKPSLMDLAPLAITRVVNKKTAAIIDVRKGGLDIVIMIEGIPELIRSLPLPRDKSLSEQLTIIQEELERTLKYYHSDKSRSGPDSNLPVFISGDLCDESEIYQYLVKKLDPDVQPAVPPLVYPQDMVPTHYTVNLGLILKKLSLEGETGLSLVNLNAIPRAVRLQPAVLSKIPVIAGVVLGVGVLAVMIMAVQNMNRQLESLRSDLTASSNFLIQKQAFRKSLNETVSTLEKGVEESIRSYGTFREVKASFSSQQDMVNGDFEVVFEKMGAGMALKSLLHSGESLALTGSALNEDAVFAYSRALEDSGHFTRVVISGMEKGPDQKVVFSLNLETGG